MQGWVVESSVAVRRALACCAAHTPMHSVDSTKKYKRLWGLGMTISECSTMGPASSSNGCPASAPALCGPLQGLTLPPIYTTAGAMRAEPPTAAATPADTARQVHILFACAHLTRLELRECQVLPGLRCLTALTVLTQLRHLQCAVSCPKMQRDLETMSAEQQQQRTMPAEMWEGLAGLTYLDIGQQVCVVALVRCGCCCHPLSAS